MPVTILHFLAVFVTGAAAAGQSSIMVAGKEYKGPSINPFGIEVSSDLDYFRLRNTERFPGFQAAPNIGLDFSLFSFAYSRADDHQRFSVNPAFLFYMTVLLFAGDPGRKDNTILSFGGMGPLTTALLLPQLLTNWSIRLDAIPQKLGLWAGPTMDYLVDKRLHFSPQLHSGVYANIGPIDLKTSIAYDVMRKKPIWVLGFGLTMGD